MRFEYGGAANIAKLREQKQLDFEIGPHPNHKPQPDKSQKWLTSVTDASHSHVDIPRVHKLGDKRCPLPTQLILPCARYRPHAQTAVLPVAELTTLAPSDGVEKPLQNLGDLVDQVFEKSNGEINNLIDEFEQLRRKLKTQSESIKRGIEEHQALSQQVMELTSTIAGSMDKVRASVDR